MVKKIIVGCVILASATMVYAGGKADSTMGENDLAWSTLPSPTKVKTFAVAGSVVYYVNETEFLIADSKKKGLTHLPAIATIPASAVSEMDADNSGKIFIGSAQGLGIKSIKEATLLTTKEGLPSNEVTKVHASRSGAVWIATSAGLCVYRNTLITSYATVGPQTKPITALASDDRGTVYVGTKKGLYVFNGATWSSQNSNTGMSDDAIAALGYDYKTQSLWAAVGDADVNSYDGKSWRIFTSVKSGISGIFADVHSRIWFAAPGGLMRYNGDEWITDAAQIGISIPAVYKIAIDTQGNMFFATDKGVMELTNQ